MGYQLKIKHVCVTVLDDLKQNAAYVHLKFSHPSHLQGYVKTVSADLSAVFKSEVPIVIGAGNNLKVTFEALPFNECIYHIPAESLALNKHNGKLQVLVPNHLLDAIKAHINQTLYAISQSAHPIELDWTQSIDTEHRFTRTTSSLYKKMRQPELKISRKRKKSVAREPADDSLEAKGEGENNPLEAILFSVAKTLSEMNEKQSERPKKKSKDRSLSRSP